jgi:ubiquinone/menaquinone biosynthesis C-methylase UbiE
LKRTTSDDYWYKRGYILEDYRFENFAPGTRILDVGCGLGAQMEDALRRGISAFGVDNSADCLAACCRKGLQVARSMAEELPFQGETFGGIICKVVLPLTDEEKVVTEMARILRPDGELELCVHGVGYYLQYLFLSPVFLTRVYALFTILNTWIYRLTGKRWRTTLYQSRRRLERYFDRCGLKLVRLTRSKRFAGFPVFLYFRLRKKS